MPPFRMIGPIKSSKSVATERTKWITGTTSNLRMRKECTEFTTAGMDDLSPPSIALERADEKEMEIAQA